jgi:hypothetical protein
LLLRPQPLIHAYSVSLVLGDLFDLISRGCDLGFRATYLRGGKRTLRLGFQSQKSLPWTAWREGTNG